jgi:hypothetical protein
MLHGSAVGAAAKPGLYDGRHCARVQRSLVLTCPWLLLDAAPADGGFANWGAGEPAGSSDSCAVATINTAQTAAGSYQWAQNACSDELVYICRKIGGCPCTAASAGRSVNIVERKFTLSRSSPPAAVPGQAPAYTAPSTGVVYILNTTLVAFDDAETNCKVNGGHLASYSSWLEQKQVGPVAA